MEVKEKEINILKNRAECMNAVHKYCNIVIPELLKELEKGFKITVNYQFHKKDKERLDAIIDKYKKPICYKKHASFI